MQRGRVPAGVVRASKLHGEGANILRLEAKTPRNFRRVVCPADRSARESRPVLSSCCVWVTKHCKRTHDTRGCGPRRALGAPIHACFGRRLWGVVDSRSAPQRSSNPLRVGGSSGGGGRERSGRAGMRSGENTGT